MYIYRLAHALGDLGHHVEVVHCIDSYHLQHPGEPEIYFEEHPNVTRHGLQSRYGFLSPLATHQTGKLLLKNKAIQEILDSKTFDVIHFHNISLFGPQVMQIASSNNEPIKLYTTHEHWLICPTHVLWKFNSRACEKPDCFVCTIRSKRPPQLWRYTKMLEMQSANVDLFLSPSQFTADMHAGRGFPYPVYHLPYFIDRQDHDWMDPQPRIQIRPYFLFVGRLEKIKGLHELIDAWQYVDDYDLLVVGSGHQAIELMKRAESRENIKFLGPKSQIELGSLYYHAQATIVPSLTFETFGIVIIESFARKTPVIVRNLGALPEVVKVSGGGVIFQTTEELLMAIRSIGKSTPLRNSLGEQGYRAFLSYWSREAHLDLYFQKLRDLSLSKFGFIPWEN